MKDSDKNFWHEMYHGHTEFDSKANYPNDLDMVLVSDGHNVIVGEVNIDDEGTWIGEENITEYKYWRDVPEPPEGWR